VAEPSLERFGQLAGPHLTPGEQLSCIELIYPVRGGRGAGMGPGAAIGNRIGQIGAVLGGKQSIAYTFPYSFPPQSRRLLCATSGRLMFLLSDSRLTSAEVIWQLPRDQVRGVERRPRTQLMARFRLHFADGSSAAVLVTRRRAIDALTEALGRWDRKEVPPPPVSP
jgi:hypothetical protein